MQTTIVIAVEMARVVHVIACLSVLGTNEASTSRGWQRYPPRTKTRPGQELFSHSVIPSIKAGKQHCIEAIGGQYFRWERSCWSHIERRYSTAISNCMG